MAEVKKDLLRLVLAAPLFAVYGAWIVLAAVARFIRSAVWTARLLKPEAQCQACGHFNALHGRWECRASGCGAVYLGAADHCERCGSGASFFPCANCGASILLRPGR